MITQLNVSFFHNYNIVLDLMGNKSAKITQKVTELSNFNSQNGDVYESTQQIRSCCGVQYIRVHKKKLQWQNQFLNNCQIIRSKYRWASDLIQIVLYNKLSRVKYLVQINNIRKDIQSYIVPQNQILLSPGEVQQFKTNLKKSVLLSFAQAKQQLDNLPKITTSINPNYIQKSKRKRRTQNSNLRMSILQNDKPFSVKTIQSKSSLRKSIISFFDDTLSSVIGGPDKQISKQNAKAVEVFLNFTMIMQKHLNDDKNILSRIQKEFVNYIKKAYSDPVVSSRNIQFITTNIKQFIVLIRQTVFDFYNLQSFPDDEIYSLINNDQNIMTIMTSILFKDKDFYRLIFNATVQFNLDNDDIFHQILKKLENSPPQYFGIKDMYCLNQLTLKKSVLDCSMESNIQDKIDNINLEQLNNNIIFQMPYKQCIQILSELQKSRTPVGKMKIIMNFSQRITKCISKFYQSNGMNPPNRALDADDMLSIFCYILANSRVAHIHTHLFIIQNFSTEHQLISVTGYYYSVLTCALEQIQMDYQNLVT